MRIVLQLVTIVLNMQVDRAARAALLCVAAAVLLMSCADAATRRPFNENWLFARGEFPEANNADFDDSAWRRLRLPHDWAIEGPFNVSNNARSGGLPVDGVGWYRKKFVSPDLSDGQRLAVSFDGAMYDAHVWVNGRFVGKRPYGYIGFEFDITDHLVGEGGGNVIAVRLHPESESSRWYPGAGLYRNVWITRRAAVHVPQWGVVVKTLSANEQAAIISIGTEVSNTCASPAEVLVEHRVISGDGLVVARASHPVKARGGLTSSQVCRLGIEKPRLWRLGDGSLYDLVTEITVDGFVIDTTHTRFGVRSIEFDAEKGLAINGESVRLNGVCLHHDLGPLGTAVNRRATERQLQIMQSMGANAIRTAHNPPSPEQLELCDEMGIAVIDEAFDCWAISKVPNDYSKYFDEWHERDLTDLIRRDRNHPSVIMWSLGNEVLEQSTEDGWKIARALSDVCRRLDPTRPTTAGFNRYPDCFDNNLVQQVDVVGLNYKPMFYAEARKEHPELAIYGSETASTVSSRGVYHLPVAEYRKHPSKQVTSYDFIAPNWAYPPDVEFLALDTTPSVLGEFVWTGFDYLGEPTPYSGADNKTKGRWNADWPARSSYFGCTDLCGMPKDRFYLYKSRWTDEPIAHLLPHWNWEDSEHRVIPVYCYTNCEEAELILNGESLGRRVLGRDTTALPVGGKHLERGLFDSPYRVRWNVPFEPGRLEVLAYRDGVVIASDQVITAGPPAAIEIEADRTTLQSDHEDLVFVTARVVDADGNPCPSADNRVEFGVTAGGEVVAVGNGDPTSTESYQATSRKAFSGKCLAILRPSDANAEGFVVTAKAHGLRSSHLSIGIDAPRGLADATTVRTVTQPQERLD